MLEVWSWCCYTSSRTCMAIAIQSDNHDGGSPHLQHDPPVDVELLEGEGQQQRHRQAPGKLEEDQGLLQRVCYFIKAPCPL